MFLVHSKNKVLYLGESGQEAMNAFFGAKEAASLHELTREQVTDKLEAMGLHRREQEPAKANAPSTEEMATEMAAEIEKLSGEFVTFAKTASEDAIKFVNDGMTTLGNFLRAAIKERDKK